MQCLIVAAGKGLRLRKRGPSKPLVELAGKPLIGHVMENAIAGGIRDFVIVTGYEATVLDAYLKGFAENHDVNIETVYNPDYEKPNGLSVAAARDVLGKRFLLSMCDHLMDPEMVRIMAGQAIKDDEVLLGTDRRVDNPLVDLEDVTRVLTDGTYIKSIGKVMAAYNCFDTGLFLSSHALIEAILLSGKKNKDYGISGGMMMLAARDKALCHDLSGFDWIDVDSPEMFALAEQHLAKKGS